MRTVTAIFPVTLLVLVATVSAEPAPPEPGESSFVALGRHDGVSRVGADLTHLVNAQGGGLLFGGALFGRYVDPGSGFGGYATLPVGFGFGVLGNANAIEISGPELGALYVRRLSSSAALLAHVGYASGPLAEDVDYLWYTGLSNPADLVNALVGGKLKLGVSPLMRSGILVARLDLGTTLLLDDASDRGPAVTFGAGAGVAVERLRVMLEVSGLAVPTESDAALMNAWLTVRYAGGRVRPYAGLGTPVTRAREMFPLLATLGFDVAL